MRASSARLALSIAVLGVLCVDASALGSSEPGQGFAQPFEPGLRWIHAASLGTPWIPTSVGFAADAELVWVGTEVQNRRLLLLDGAGAGVVQPTKSDDGVMAASYVLDVQGTTAAGLFSLTQYPDPDLFQRRSVLARHDLIANSNGLPFVPQWSFECAFVDNGTAKMAVDARGERAALAVSHPATGSVRLHLLDVQAQTLLWQEDIVADSLDSLAISADGSTLAVSVGRRLLIKDHHGTDLLPAKEDGQAYSMAFDEKGERLIVGSPELLRVYEFDGALYQLDHAQVGGADEGPLRVALSEDGETYAAAWYRYTATDSLRLEVRDSSTHALRNSLTQAGIPNGLQNSPVGLVINPTGERIAMASWGQGNGLAEVVLIQKGQVEPVLEVNLPGSAMDLDLDDSGTQLVVSTKNLHANQVGSTGEIRLYDTGERDLHLSAPARLGGQLQVDSKRAGSRISLFLVGDRMPQSQTLPGMTGELHLARNNRLKVYGRVSDSEGQASLSTSIPFHPSVAGVDLAVQVAHRVSGQIVFSDHVIDPLIY